MPEPTLNETMLTDCYEKGHTPYPDPLNLGAQCSKCGEMLTLTDAGVWRTQAELDRLWKGVDREAESDVGGRHGG